VIAAAPLRAAPPPFAIPPGAAATAPPERRGVPRDGVRLMVVRPAGVTHRRFRDLTDELEAGDLLVVNTSATLPAALDAARGDGRPSVLHVSADLGDGEWVVEVRRPDGAGPAADAERGERLRLPGGRRLRLAAPFPDPAAPAGRLWRARARPATELSAYLADHGRPIAYGHLRGRFPLSDRQNVYAADSGSAEMASAGRPFTAALLVRLMARGVTIAPVVLHAGVSSPERSEPPPPERFAVPADTARLARSAASAGRRVVAVGTTATRALESAAGADGTVRAASGWTDLVLGPDRPARAVTGIVTGLHEPEASHLLLLEAVAGPGLVRAAYEEAVAERYLWHEFGDSMLFLPRPRRAAGLSRARRDAQAASGRGRLQAAAPPAAGLVAAGASPERTP
jgi:S-adenosylmethionine:tRNA ribosyltransferase-isomerase